MHEYSPKHSRMGKAIIKLDKETIEKCDKRGVRMEISKAGTREKLSPDGLNYIARAYRSLGIANPSTAPWENGEYNNNNKHNILLLYTRWKKVQ